MDEKKKDIEINNNWNSNLDIVRVFSAILVLSIHIGQYTRFEFNVGATGVQLFFILSGYLGFVSLEKEYTKEYYKKRLFRILPTYYICLTILYVYNLICDRVAYGSFSSALSEGICGIKFLRYVFFAQLITPSDNWKMWNNYSALWTMSSFAIFYLIAPLLYKMINRFSKALILVIILLFSRSYIVTFIQNLFFMYPEESRIDRFAQHNPLVTLYCFILGVTLFLAIKENKTNIYALLILCTLIATNFSWFSHELLFTILIMAAVLMPNIINNEKFKYFLKFISGGSFTLYLIHPMVLTIINLDTCGLKPTIFLYIVCLFISYTIYYLIITKIENSICKYFLH